MIRLTTEAARDLELVVDWYDEQRSGLGKIFLLDLRQAFEHIELFPEGYSTVRPNVRRTLLARFPYAVTYRLIDDGPVVIAVLHQKRGRERVPKSR